MGGDRGDRGERSRKNVEKNEEEELPLGWERRESDIRPGQFYYTNPTTRQVALTLEEAKRDHERRMTGEDKKRKSAWDQKEDDKRAAEETRRRGEDKVNKLLSTKHRSSWDQRRWT